MHGLGMNSESNPTGAYARRRRWTGALEALETRALLSGSPTIYTVDLTSDTGAGSNGTGDLLNCIEQANANTNPAGSLIEFSPLIFSANSPQRITLSSTLKLTEAGGPEMIEGPGAAIVTISGNPATVLNMVGRSLPTMAH
jgi:hypothetical protein